MKLFPAVPPPAPAPTFRRPTRSPVAWSEDLRRVLAVPRRDLPTAYTQADVDALERRLRRDPAACACAKLRRPCPTHLRLSQAHALLEAPRAGGLVAALGVGHGKTLIDLLLAMVFAACKVAVLLIPASLRSQLLDADWDYYGGHWKLPNLVGGRTFNAGRPALHVLTYNKFSRPESSAELKRILMPYKPHERLVICDESHSLKDPTSVRTSRFQRTLDEFPSVLCILSGTTATRSPRDCAHLFGYALGSESPLPLQDRVTKEWATALDPVDDIAPPGALERLCEPGEHVREGYRRRRNDTLGVVWAPTQSTDAGLVIRRRTVALPTALDTTYVAEDRKSLTLAGHIHAAHNGKRPDGEVMMEELRFAECARQLACGFFHRWRYPRGEAPELIDRWFMRRQEWNRERREMLKHPQDELDSPALLENAARRFYSPATEPHRLFAWRSFTWPAWAAIEDEVQPVGQACWLSDFLVQDAAAWARKNVGIVWTQFPELSERIARAAKVPYFGEGEQASEDIRKELGDRSIVASIQAHHWGKNLQVFSRNLVVTPPADGAMWEQLIGRTHRDGQLADEVEVEVYQHTPLFVDAFDKARERAMFLHQTDGPQRLVLATFDDTWR